ncbi:hypothetical protein [Leptolyngbya sp. 7M]|uniref:hypothetical protein n=1 Tax=Leptolyngbya sp. 7M TaxID=2812896 RepID=UPI001B8CC85A|nr:hypothetical protein [Leptolyngbya sp. 7M]QYO67334.1 hypothetical protein JVX88_11330 [Leptolyngbya sp. 7M]
MNIEQAVLDNLRELPFKNQEEVLAYIKALQQKLKPEAEAQQIHWGQIAEQLLPDLRRMQWLHDGSPSAVYADSLLRTMQNLFDQAPSEPLTEVLMVLHDAMTFQNRWINYTPEQYQFVYVLPQKLSGLVFYKSHRAHS